MKLLRDEFFISRGHNFDDMSLNRVSAIFIGTQIEYLRRMPNFLFSENFVDKFYLYFYKPDRWLQVYSPLNYY